MHKEPKTMVADTREADIQNLLSRLAAADPKDRAYALRALAEAPLAEPSLLAAAEALLGDETLTLLSIPYVFGEIRWQAAAAVAALRGMLNRSDDVRLVDVPMPLTPDKIGLLAREAGLSDTKGGIEGSLEMLARLRALDRVPRRDLLRAPWREDER